MCAGDLADLIEANGDRRVRYAVQTLRGGADSYADLMQRVRDVFAPPSPPDPEMAALLDDETAAAGGCGIRRRMAQLDPEVVERFRKAGSAVQTGCARKRARRTA